MPSFALSEFFMGGGANADPAPPVATPLLTSVLMSVCEDITFDDRWRNPIRNTNGPSGVDQ